MVEKYVLPVVVVLVALALYDMFVKKALKIDAYDDTTF